MTQNSIQASAPARVLIFCRAYLVDDFRENVAPLASEYDFYFLCDGKKTGTDDTRTLFYRHLNDKTPWTLLDADERADVIARCRLLRNLRADKANALVNAMGLTLESWFAQIAPRAVLCHMVDEYVTHLASIIARKRGIVYVGYAGSFFPDRVQLTQFGNGIAFDVREPDDAEVEATIAALLKPRFRQDYAQKLAYSKKRHAMLMARYFAKRLVFSLKGLTEGDRDNVHYIITPFIVDRRRLSDFPDESDFQANWQELAQQGAAAGKPAIYLPLGYFPESTIDYWIPDTRILDYETITLTMAKALAARFTVLVKEHPHMLGARPPSFYASLAAIDGVINVPPLAFSDDAMALSVAVILGAGSGGVEAALRGKPIFSYGPTCYWYAASGAQPLDLADIANWPDMIAKSLAGFIPLTQAQRHALIAQCLRSTVRKRAAGKRWPLVNLDDLRAILQKAVAAAKNHEPETASGAPHLRATDGSLQAPAKAKV